MVFDSQLQLSPNLNTSPVTADHNQHTSLFQEPPAIIIENQMNMLSSPLTENPVNTKIVQFYETIISKMSEEMQRLLLSQSKIFH